MALPGAQERIEGQTIMHVLGALGALGAAGYAAHLMARPGAMVPCDACGAASPARDVPMRRLARREGPSDRGSEVAVAAVECPRCGARGA